MAKNTRNKKFDTLLYRQPLCGTLAGSPSAIRRNLRKAKKSTVLANSELWQLFDGNRQVYYGEQYWDQPRARYNKRTGKKRLPPKRLVKIQYPLGKPNTHVMVENATTGFSYKCPVERLGLEWKCVTPKSPTK